jgi:hypothetical protein
MPQIATYVEVQRALQEQVPTILKQIPAPSVQLSMPVDGQGPRIQASAKDDERSRIPSHVDVRLDGRAVTIPIEVAPDYHDFEAY